MHLEIRKAIFIATVLALLPISVVAQDGGSVDHVCLSDILAPEDTGVEPTTGKSKSATHELAVYYVVPADITYDTVVHNRLIEATLRIQAWYQIATGGLTWKLAYPEIVQVYYADSGWQYYRDSGNWWGSLPGEMSTKGHPIWQSGTVTALLAQGAGWWAGGAQWCGVDCGLMILGVEAFPEFNNPTYSGDLCPGGTGVAAWPCTPEGAYAHELGHTLGLPHPVDVPATNADASHSVMQSHWNFPDYDPPADDPWGLLTLERVTLSSNPFMYEGVSIDQTFKTADIVNLPANGVVPDAQISYVRYGNEVEFVSTSIDAVRHYWMFGDGNVSNEVSPVHTYADTAVYKVHLRVSSVDEMIDVDSLYVIVDCCSLIGNVNGSSDGQIDISDLTYLVGYMFSGGPEPPCLLEANINFSGGIDISDLTHLVAYMFSGGPPPVGDCG